MKKLSQHYRNDSVAGIDTSILEYLNAEFLPTLENLDLVNPKVLVVFSGGNATGKSALSQKIGRELHGVVIENDAIKRAILRKIPDFNRQDEFNPLTWRYSMYLYSRLPELTTNGLIVRDGVIDWYFDRILPIFEKEGYKIFVVQYEISKEKSAELIHIRGDTPTVTTEELIMQLDDHEIHQKRFRSKYKADVILDESHVFDHDKVIERLKLVIAGLNSKSS